MSTVVVALMVALQGQSFQLPPLNDLNCGGSTMSIPPCPSNAHIRLRLVQADRETEVSSFAEQIPLSCSNEGLSGILTSLNQIPPSITVPNCSSNKIGGHIQLIRERDVPNNCSEGGNVIGEAVQSIVCEFITNVCAEAAHTSLSNFVTTAGQSTFDVSTFDMVKTGLDTIRRFDITAADVTNVAIVHQNLVNLVDYISGHASAIAGRLTETRRDRRRLKKDVLCAIDQLILNNLNGDFRSRACRETFADAGLAASRERMQSQWQKVSENLKNMLTLLRYWAEG